MAGETGPWSQWSRVDSESVFEATVKETGKSGSMEIQDRGNIGGAGLVLELKEKGLGTRASVKDYS